MRGGRRDDERGEELLEDVAVRLEEKANELRRVVRHDVELGRAGEHPLDRLGGLRRSGVISGGERDLQCHHAVGLE